jgi:hypothetical protein
VASTTTLVSINENLLVAVDCISLVLWMMILNPAHQFHSKWESVLDSVITSKFILFSVVRGCFRGTLMTTYIIVWAVMLSVDECFAGGKRSCHHHIG